MTMQTQWGTDWNSMRPIGDKGCCLDLLHGMYSDLDVRLSPSLARLYTAGQEPGISGSMPGEKPRPQFLHLNFPSWPPLFLQHFSFVWPTWWQLLHLSVAALLLLFHMPKLIYRAMPRMPFTFGPPFLPSLLINALVTSVIVSSFGVTISVPAMLPHDSSRLKIRILTISMSFNFTSILFRCNARVIMPVI